MSLRFVFVAALLIVAPSGAGARSERVVGWTAERVFPTAIRFLRVDEQATIVDKDVDAGYVLFDVRDDGKLWRGALELIATADDPPQLRLVLRIDDRPDYVEVAMLDRLERKLRDELGTPARPPRPGKPGPDDKKKPDREKPR